jgi:hypothetical protein
VSIFYAFKIYDLKFKAWEHLSVSKTRTVLETSSAVGPDFINLFVGFAILCVIGVHFFQIQINFSDSFVSSILFQGAVVIPLLFFQIRLYALFPSVCAHQQLLSVDGQRLQTSDSTDPKNKSQLFLVSRKFGVRKFLSPTASERPGPQIDSCSRKFYS